MRTCTRKLEFDYGHRLLRHESKCAHVHGHRGVVEVTCAAPELDPVGRVVDFGCVRNVVGGWIDRWLDHAFILNAEDHAMFDFLKQNKQRMYVMQCEPSAENIARMLRLRANELLLPHGVRASHVRFYETPNGWADSVEEMKVVEVQR